MRVLVLVGILVSSVCMAGYAPDIKPKSVTVNSTGHIIEWIQSLFK